METASLASNTPTTHLGKDVAWKSNKRFSERECSDLDDDDTSSSSSSDLVMDQGQSKRFKAMMTSSTSSSDSCFESPVNLNAMLRQKRLFQHEPRFQEIQAHMVLSPISELSMNLTDTSLNAEVDHGFEDCTTPLKRLRNGLLGAGGGGALKNLKEPDEDGRILATKDYCMASDKLGDEEDYQVSAIIPGSQNASISIDQVPYTVQLRERNDKHACGGTLIAPQFVVTAAHCFEKYGIGHFKIVAGTTSAKEQNVVVNIKRLFIHPLYESGFANYDVAVLKLNRPIFGEHVDAIELCDEDTVLEEGEMLRISGWGKQADDELAKPAETLQSVLIPIMSDVKCAAIYDEEESDVEKVSDEMVCAHGAEGEDACQGDSGGPAVYNGQLCAVISWGRDCGSDEYPGVYVRIDSVRDFIEHCLKQ